MYERSDLEVFGCSLVRARPAVPAPKTTRPGGSRRDILSKLPSEGRSVLKGGILRMSAQPSNTRPLVLGTLSFAVCFMAWGLISAFAPRFREMFSLSATQTALLVAVPVLLKVRDNQVVRFEPWEEFPFNQGMLCPKGSSAISRTATPTGCSIRSCGSLAASARPPGTRRSTSPRRGASRFVGVAFPAGRPRPRRADRC
jgi:hypothetical protein